MWINRTAATRLRCLGAILALVLFSAGSGCAAQAKKSARTTPAPVRGSGLSRVGYAVQVGAFKEVGNAERLTKRLQEKGIEAFYFRKENGIYAVRFGDYASKEQANREAKRLLGGASFFVAPPQRVPSLRDGAASVQRPQPPEVKPAPVGNGKTPPPRTSPPRERDREEMGNIAARTAERFVGIPYRWGGETVVDGMDCSGFARAVYNLCGVNIPRTSREQFQVGDPVAREELADGDLVFFGASRSEINHVGIYVGNGRFVHAPRRGDDIKVSTLDEAYFTKRFVGARRYF